MSKPEYPAYAKPLVDALNAIGAKFSTHTCDINGKDTGYFSILLTDEKNPNNFWTFRWQDGKKVFEGYQERD